VAGCWGDHGGENGSRKISKVGWNTETTEPSAFWETTKEVARKLKAQLARDTEEQSETGFTLH